MKQLRQFLIALAVITLILGMFHYFIFVVAGRSLAKDLSLALLFGLMLTGLISMPLGMAVSMSPFKNQFRTITLIGYFWMGFFMISFFWALIEFVIALNYLHSYSYWILVVSLLVSIWAFFNGIRLPTVIKWKLQGPNFLKGLKIAQISDVHVGMPYIDEKWLTGVVGKINAQDPDIVVITGDLTDGEFAEISPLLAPLAKLNAKDKFYITGNHEYLRGGEWEARLGQLGFHVLHNSHKILYHNGSPWMMAGVPDRLAGRFQSGLESNPDKALTSSEPVGYKILLAHQPKSVFDLKTQSCDLILSGHTHAGQIFPFAVFVRMAQPVVKGFKTLRGIKVYAHQGTGRWGPPMRWLTTNEIALFEWT